jgi:hypothetical protein
MKKLFFIFRTTLFLAVVSVSTYATALCIDNGEGCEGIVVNGGSGGSGGGSTGTGGSTGSGNTGNNGNGNGQGGGGGSNTGTTPEQKARECEENKRMQDAASCQYRTALPYSIGGMSFPGDIALYPSFAELKQPLYNWITTISRSNNPYIHRDWAAGLSSVLAACGSRDICAQQALVYFGQAHIAIPEIPRFGDVNGLTNWLLSRILPGGFDGSSAAQLQNKYQNGAYCSALKYNANLLQCPA